MFQSTFDDFLADWSPVPVLPVYDDSAPGVTTLWAQDGEVYGRANSLVITPMAGLSFSELRFSVDLTHAGDNGSYVWIAYFQGLSFLAAEGVFVLPPNGALEQTRLGSTLEHVPVDADSFMMILYGMSPESGAGTGFDLLTVMAPEPSLAVPTGLLALAMLRARRRNPLAS